MDAFVSWVWDTGASHARAHLPWRNTCDPYAIYVSEVMLQQTQVARVLKYWQPWIDRWPTVDALASAATSDVLECWQGLGYNRRALALKRSAEVCSKDYGGALPTAFDDLLALPGVGPATAAGVTAFAYNKPCVYLETNVRAVFIHWFFADAHDPVPEKDLRDLVQATCSTDDPRGWYYALLDVGAHLKATRTNPSRKAAAYSRQSAFEGSQRQKRAFIVREVLAAPGIAADAVHTLLNDAEQAAGRPPVDAAMFETLLDALAAEGFFTHDKRTGRLSC